MAHHTITLLASDSSLELKNNWPDSLAWIGQIFFLIFLVVIVVLLAYLTTRMLGSTRLTKRNGNIGIIESVAVGYQSSVQLIKVGSKHILIGVTKEKITFLTEVDKESLKIDNVAQGINNIPFEKMINKYLQKNKPDL